MLFKFKLNPFFFKLGLFEVMLKIFIASFQDLDLRRKISYGRSQHLILFFLHPYLLNQTILLLFYILIPKDKWTLELFCELMHLSLNSINFICLLLELSK